MPSKSNPFIVLGLAQDCTLDQAKRHFRELALKFHPDKVPADQKEAATRKMALFNDAMDKVREILENSPPSQPSKSHSEHSTSRADADADAEADEQYQHFLIMYEDFRVRLASLCCWMKASSCSDPAHKTKLDSTRMACDRAMSDFMKYKPSSESEVSTWSIHWSKLIKELTSKVHQATETFPCPYCRRTESSDSFDSTSSAGQKANALKRQHAKLVHKIEEIFNVVRTRTSSHEIGVPGFYYLCDQLELASKLVADEDLEAARISTKSIRTVVEGIRKKVKEFERRANARRTIGGQYRPEEVEALNATVTSLIGEYLTGQKRSNGEE